jgi:pimeloyl-ACP methyl ester carboxylesterase
MAHTNSVDIEIRAPQIAATKETAMPPIWKETLWPIEWMSLRLSPVYFGIGVPRGDGSPVILVPGFLGTDAYLLDLYLWLKRIGYRPCMSGIGVNAECPGRLTEKVVRTAEKARAETGRSVRLIGHSLGGIIGRRACVERPELFSQLISLGSPVQGISAHPAIGAAVSLLRFGMSAFSFEPGDCLSERCSCSFVSRLVEPLPGNVDHASIYTRHDGVVPWRDARHPDESLNHEVGGTHIGLVYNVRAYRAVAALLAKASSHERFAA